MSTRRPTNQRGSAAGRTAAATLSNAIGQAFQARLASTLDGYRRAGRADLQKIDPPVRCYGTGYNRKVVFLANPWLDYAGCWTEYQGRSIHLEAKATEGERLAIGRAGVSDTQLDSMRRWTSAGAVAAVVWGYGNEMRIVTATELLTAWDAGAKSIQWRHLAAVHRGTGLIEFDILAELAARTF